jgi:hypothetical protein
MKKNWWSLYPFIGLEITDKRSGFDKPLFRNFHILNSNSAKSLASHIKYQNIKSKRVASSDHISVKHIEKWFEPIGRDCDSLIAVRKWIDDDDKIMEEALDDANLFAAIVALACYSQNFNLYYYALRENLVKYERKIGAAFSIEGQSMTTGHHSQISSSPSIYIQPKIWKMKRSELKKIILNPQLGFGRMLLNSDPKLKPYRHQLQAAVLTLDNAIRQRDRSSILLGSVNAIDMLFSDDGHSNFKRLKQRITVILNEPTVSWLKVDDVFQARHNFIHDGQRVVEPELAARARHTALMAIIMYSNLASFFKNRPTMFSYLDAIAQIKNVSSRPQGEVAADITIIAKKIRKEFIKLTKIGYTRNLVVNDAMADYMMGRTRTTKKKN